MKKYTEKNCFHCKNTFFALNSNTRRRIVKYCSTKCRDLSKITIITVYCKQCNKKFDKLPNQIKKTKNNFCNNSCAATYNNTHKTKGTRISKLEKYLQIELFKIFPKLNIKYNEKNFSTELDIYIPLLNMAFEINGIFHYKPIYGKEKFNQIKNNDLIKKEICKNNKINLFIINSSDQLNFNIETSKKYLYQITSYINIFLNEINNL